MILFCQAWRTFPSNSTNLDSSDFRIRAQWLPRRENILSLVVVPTHQIECEDDILQRIGVKNKFK